MNRMIDTLVITGSHTHYVIVTVTHFLLGLLAIWVVFTLGYRCRDLLCNLRVLVKILISRNQEWIWRNRFPSFEDMHAFFDRGDAMLAAVLTAASMQLSNDQVGEFILAHSTYKTYPWRRVIRTLAFIRMTVRANSEQRSKIIVWINRIHKHMSLFKFDTNTFILATIAYGLARAHGVLGSVTEVELDALVSTIMSMADKINSADRGKPVPKSLSDVEKYLSSHIVLNSPRMTNIFEDSYGLINVVNRRNAVVGIKARTFFYKPWSWIRLVFLQRLVADMCRVILPRTPGVRIPTWTWFLSTVRIFHPLWYHLHNNTCPYALTLDGLFELLVDCDPSLQKEIDAVYEEVFGDDHADLKAQKEPNGNMLLAHLPQVESEVDHLHARGRREIILTQPSMYEALLEHLMCSYYRTRLSAAVAIAGSGGDRSKFLIPQHLGVIMDGNRRYSKENLLGSVIEGHRMGAHKLLQFMSWSFSAGINNLTLWALSDDNLKRPEEELNPLFSMMASYVREILAGDSPIAVLDIRFRVVGNRSLLPASLNEAIDLAEKATQGNGRFNLQLALAYGGRGEIMHAFKEAVKSHARGESIAVDEALRKLKVSDVSDHIYSAELGLPQIDAILRTSGERRSSGFAMWESQAAELCFLAPNWPSVKQSDFLRSLVDLSERQRRFGS